MNIKTIGILGSGQLGRMIAIAAAEMGVRAHIFAPMLLAARRRGCP